MRKLSDNGKSANTRYNESSNEHGINVSNSQMIRMFADYNKCIKVLSSMIKVECKIDGKSERLWFTIWSDDIKYKYNGKQIRVRLVLDDPFVIYLFDPHTDTYLGFLERDLEPAGDAANQTDADKKYMMAHASKIKGQQKARVLLKDKILEDVNAFDKENELPESFSTPILIDQKRQSESDYTFNNGDVDEEPNEIDQHSKEIQENITEADELIGDLETIAVVNLELSDEELELDIVT